MRGRLRSVGLAAAVLAALAATGCGSSSHKVSAASLNPRLAPLSVAPGFHVERTLDWSDPLNLVGEGIRTPEITHPSEAVKEVRSAGFQGAAGEILNRGGPNGATIITGVIKLASPGDATKLQSWMHRQDLTQPCFAQCIFSPRNFPISGIPHVTAVRQVPNKNAGPPPGLPPGAKAPPGAGPPTNYLFEFTIGKYLYFGSTQGEAKDAPKVVAGARTYYTHVKGLGAS